MTLRTFQSSIAGRPVDHMEVFKETEAGVTYATGW